MTLTQINRAGLDADALDRVFTIGASGSSAYTFQGEGLNGTVNNPTLYLTRGKTYRFENGSGGHPIRIQSTSGASGTAYNTGVTNNAGSGTVIVEVQHDAPDILYYQCTSHAAMNGILYITGALADGGVTTAKLADQSVTTAKLGNAAAGTDQIAHGAIVTIKLADDAVTEAKIANDAVRMEHILAGAVTDSELASNAVTSAKIADNAVTLAKLPHGTSSNDGKFLRANNGGDPTFETVTSVGGATGVDFNDDVKARFGTGNDLEIYHDGANSVIREAGTGALFVGGDTVYLYGSGTGETMLRAFQNGAVELYYDNSKKYETVAAGSYQYGNLRLPDTDAKIELKDGNNYIQFLNTDKEFKFMNAWGAGEFTFYPGGYERLRIDSNGIKFNGDTAAANALDDYEEGTFTPTVSQGITSPTLAEAEGTYTKIGNVVKFNFFIRVASGGGSSNGQQFKFGGLPFTQNNNNGRRGFGVLSYSNAHGLNYETGHHLYIYGNVAELWSGLHHVTAPSTSNQQYRYFIGGGHYYA